MNVDEYIRTISELMAQELGDPLPAALGMTPTQCHQWLERLYAKQVSLRDAQQTVRAVIAQKGVQVDQDDIDDLLHYV